MPAAQTVPKGDSQVFRGLLEALVIISKCRRQILKIRQIVAAGISGWKARELATEIVGSASEERQALRAAPASVLAQSFLRSEGAGGKQGVKFLLVHGSASRPPGITDFQRQRV